MPSLGLPELVIILVIVMLVFGVGKLGDAGSALGKAMKEFRSASKDLQDTADEVKSSAKDAAGLETRKDKETR